MYTCSVSVLAHPVSESIAGVWNQIATPPTTISWLFERPGQLQNSHIVVFS